MKTIKQLQIEIAFNKSIGNDFWASVLQKDLNKMLNNMS